MYTHTQTAVSNAALIVSILQWIGEQCAMNNVLLCPPLICFSVHDFHHTCGMQGSAYDKTSPGHA